MTPDQHAATVRDDLDAVERILARCVSAAEWGPEVDRIRRALVALAERATELERERDEWKNRAEYEEDQKRIASKAYLDLSETAPFPVVTAEQLKAMGLPTDDDIGKTAP